MSERPIECDVAIFGGGIAGLWLLRRLIAQGHRAVLFQRGPLGAGQTIASQGVIHGGLKYALNGWLNDASEALGAMPGRWTACLQGQGELDLRAVTVLSPCQYLWSSGNVASRMTAFLASKTLAGRVGRFEPGTEPDAFRNDRFRGALFRLEETVIDPVSLVAVLSEPVRGALVAVTDPVETVERGAGGPIRLQLGGRSVLARHVVLTAGAGNAELMASWPEETLPRMQRRPLHQVWLRSPILPPLFGVAIGSGTKPPLVVTTSFAPDGSRLWYLGGELAEQGIDRSAEAQIAAAQDTVQRWLPWIELGEARWATLRADRAEALQPDGSRPAGPFAATSGSVTVGWPTKLAFAPRLADEICAHLEAASVRPSGQPGQCPDWGGPVPDVAPPAWEGLL